MTPLFLPQHLIENNHSPDEAPFTAIGYRDYVDTRNAHDADENLKTFRHLLLSLKDNDGNAISYFAGLLEIVFDKVIGKVDLITCVPGHDKTPPTRVDPLASLVERVAQSTQCRNGNSILQRKLQLTRAHQDPRPRNFTRQFDSIEAKHSAHYPDAKRILIIDDIYSSGKTMAACYSHLKRRFPSAKFVGFAFGRTTSTPMVRWPQMPAFPGHHGLQHNLTTVLAQLQQEAEKNRNFSRDQGIVIGRWNKKIHRITCRHLPNQYWFLESVSQGISEGGILCRVCRPRDVK